MLQTISRLCRLRAGSRCRRKLCTDGAAKLSSCPLTLTHWVRLQVYSSEGKGYVQDVFAREGGGLDGASTAAVAIGQKQFFEQLTNLLLERGVSQEGILSNY